MTNNEWTNEQWKVGSRLATSHLSLVTAWGGGGGGCMR